MRELKVASIFLLGATIGGGGGYWVAYSTLKKGYDRAVQAEVDEVREHYKVIHKDRSYETPEDYAAEKAEQSAVELEEHLENKAEHNMRVAAYAIEQERGEAQAASVLQPTVEHRSIFDYNNLKDPEKEEVIDTSAVRIISFEEFDSEDEYTKASLTYYKTDDTVADEVDEILHDVQAAIGPDALGLFSEQDSVYIRNDVMRTDFEIVLVENSYQAVVQHDV